MVFNRQVSVVGPLLLKLSYVHRSFISSVPVNFPLFATFYRHKLPSYSFSFLEFCLSESSIQSQQFFFHEVFHFMTRPDQFSSIFIHLKMIYRYPISSSYPCFLLF